MRDHILRAVTDEKELKREDEKESKVTPSANAAPIAPLPTRHDKY